MTDKQPSFALTRKGYTPAEVDAYISSLRDHLTGVTDDLAKARDELVVTHDELTVTQSDLETLRADLDAAKKAAQDEADAILDEARAEAEAKIADAQQRVAGMIDEADVETEEIRSTIRAEEDEMRQRLRTRENEITTELDAIDSKVGDRTTQIAQLEKRLAAEEARYTERIHTLRSVAAGLEDGLRVVVEGSLVELGVFLQTHEAAVVDNDIVGAAVHHHFTTDALLAASPTIQEQATPRNKDRVETNHPKAIDNDPEDSNEAGCPTIPGPTTKTKAKGQHDRGSDPR